MDIVQGLMQSCFPQSGRTPGSGACEGKI